MSVSPVSDPQLEVLRKRTLYRAWHRGTKELDLILGRFGEAHFKTFDAEMLMRFEALMSREETQLQQWLLGQVEIPDTREGDLLRQIREFHLNNPGDGSDR